MLYNKLFETSSKLVIMQNLDKLLKKWLQHSCINYEMFIIIHFIENRSFRLRRFYFYDNWYILSRVAEILITIFKDSNPLQLPFNIRFIFLNHFLFSFVTLNSSSFASFHSLYVLCLVYPTWSVTGSWGSMIQLHVWLLCI